MFRFVVAALLVAFSALAVGLALGGRTDYPVERAEARRLLAATDPPEFVFGGRPPEFERRPEESRITWIARRDGVELFRYVATLGDAGRGRTWVDLELKGSEVVARKLAARPAVRDLYLAAMHEQIASTLERRDYDMVRLGLPTTAANVEAMGPTRASVDRAAKASRPLSQESDEPTGGDDATR